MQTTSAVLALTIGGEIAERTGVVELWYGSPYVALVAVVTHRFGLRCGLLATALSSVLWNHIFSAPKWMFNTPTASEMTIYLSMLAVAVLIAPRAKQPEEPRIYDRGNSLPFTRDDKSNGGLHGAGRHFWDVRPSGNWGEDCEVGFQYARVYLNRARTGEAAPLLGWIVGGMIEAGRYTGIEAGFAQGIADAVLTNGAPEAAQHLRSVG